MLNVLRSGRTHLVYRGAREYISGVDLFDAFERFARGALEPERSPRELFAFKLIREVERDGRWEVGPNAAALATLDWTDANGEAVRASFVEDGEVVTERGEDNPAQVVTLDPEAPFEGRAVLRAPGTAFDYLCGLVQTNKALHGYALEREGAPQDAIRLIFVERVPFGALPDGETALRFHHLGRRTHAGRTYTLAEARPERGGEPTRICFSC